MLWREFILARCDCSLERILISGSLLDYFHENRVVNLLGEFVRSEIEVDILGRVNEIVTDNLNYLIILSLAVYVCKSDAGILNLHGSLA